MKTVEERFREKYDVDDVTGCWNWNTGSKTFAFTMYGKSYQAHRASFLLHKGELEKHQTVVVQSCGGKRCVNPDHLFEESHSSAARRKAWNGRRRVSLTLEEVQDARRLQTEGYSIDDILEEFCTDKHSIMRKVLNEPSRWSQVPSTHIVGSPNNRPKGSAHSESILNEDIVREILTMRKNGSSYKEIHNAFSEYKESTLNAVIYGLSWTHVIV